MNIRYGSQPIVNVWSDPGKAREVDGPVVKEPYDFFGWLEGISDQYRRDLVGRLETQILYGEPVAVLEERDGWSRVVVPGQYTHKDERGYPGWIPSPHLVGHPDYHQVWEENPHAYVMTTRTRLHLEDGNTIPLSYMSKLPRIGERDGDVLVLTPDGKTGRLPLSDVRICTRMPVTDAASRIEDARRFTGLPYLWAGMSAYGFDCSGMMYRLFEAGGIRIPRDADDQSRSGVHVPREALRAGDLVFFAYEEGTGAIHHVGMMVDNTRFIHSPRTGLPVKINQLTDQPYHAECCGGARYDGSELI